MKKTHTKVPMYSKTTNTGCAGQYVSRAQKVHNMDFFYQPPPRNVVPQAAALKAHHPRSAMSSKTHAGHAMIHKKHAASLQQTGTRHTRDMQVYSHEGFTMHVAPVLLWLTVIVAGNVDST